MTPETNSRIAHWRQKAQEGTLTEEDMIEAIKVLSAGRSFAATASTKSRASKAQAAAPKPNADDLVADLFGDDL